MYNYVSCKALDYILLPDVPTVPIASAVGLDKGVRYSKFKVHDDMVSHLLYLPMIDRVIPNSQ